MAGLDIGDVVKYLGEYHDLDDETRGRICKRFGTQYFWVNFPDLGCVIVKATSLRAATGSAPVCTGCPS